MHIQLSLRVNFHSCANAHGKIRPIVHVHVQTHSEIYGLYSARACANAHGKIRPSVHTLSVCQPMVVAWH